MSAAVHPSDAELAHRAKGGDKDAFNALVRRHKAAVYRFVRRSVGDPDDAYDILQDTFVSAWLALKRFDTTRSFVVWLRAIARNKCRDYGRRGAARRRLQAILAWMMPVSDPTDAIRRDELETREALRLRHLDQAIAALPPFYREPLVLATVSGLSQQEIAAELNTTAKAVEMRIRRAKKKLGDAMADFSGEG